MEWDGDDLLVRALRSYVRLVAEALGLSGEGWYVQAERPRSVYLAMDGRLPGCHDRDVALIWDESAGWALAVETHSGEDLVIQAQFGAERVPAPSALARWVRQVFAGDSVTRVPLAPAGRIQADLAACLSPYTTCVPEKKWREVQLPDAAEHPV